MKSIRLIFGLLIIAVFACCNFKQDSSSHPATMATHRNIYVVERSIPGAGHLTKEELKAISQTSCNVLKEMGPDISWIHSYITSNKIYSVYTAQSEEMVREHARQGGFSVSSIERVSNIIDPSTASR